MSVARSIFWNLWSLWKPVTAVFAMHSFHHLAIWLSQFSFEHTWFITRLILLDPWVQSYLPYSFTHILEDGWKDWTTWFSWVGFQFRNEASLWMLVLKDDQLFQHRFALYQGAEQTENGHKYRQALMDSLLITDRERASKFRSHLLFGVELLDSEEDANFGYQEPKGLPFSQEVGPTPGKNSYIHTHNPDNDYRAGRANTFYVDPSEYQTGPNGSITDNDDNTDDDDDGNDGLDDFNRYGYNTGPLNRGKSQSQRELERRQREYRIAEAKRQKILKATELQRQKRLKYDSEMNTTDEPPKPSSPFLRDADSQQHRYVFDSREDYSDIEDSYLYDK